MKSTFAGLPVHIVKPGTVVRDGTRIGMVTEEEYVLTREAVYFTRRQYESLKSKIGAEPERGARDG